MEDRKTERKTEPRRPRSKEQVSIRCKHCFAKICKHFFKKHLYIFVWSTKVNNTLFDFFLQGIEWKWWDRIVLSWIFLNTIQLAMFNPFDIPALKPDSPQRAAMDAIGT